jgi:Holliday junction DNA helicase RuvB
VSTISEAAFQEIFALAKPKIAGPKRGAAIFTGTDYPRKWADFIGQEQAKEQLQVAVESATARKTRLDHTLLASGIAGVGKTTLAYLLAYQMGVGITATSGPLTMEKTRDMIKAMKDRDILFIDEIHTVVAGGKNKADWLLPFMSEGKFYTSKGAEQMPDVTIIGATTDAGKLPATLLSRFMMQPTIERYSATEAAAIGKQLATRMKVSIPVKALPDVARAADGNPRMMRQVLTAVRDLGYAYPDTHPNLEKAFKWSGVSADGLSEIARDMLLLLLAAKDNTASIDSLRAQLGEPGPLHHHEQVLMQRAFLTVTGRGRKLTDLGLARAHEEAVTRSSAATAVR